MVHLNITMPEDIVKDLKHIRNKSRFIAQLLRERFEHQKKEKLEKLLREEYRQAAKEDKRINQEWEQATLDSWPE